MDQISASGILPDATTPYVLRAGEGDTLLVAGQIIRVLARGSATSGAFGIVICTAPLDRMPIPMHWHAHEHDTWFCTRGKLRVWCKQESRILHPGDFAYVKPGDTHSYRSVAPHTEFFGVVAPGGWEGFFYESGESYAGAIFPEPERSFDFRRMGPAMAKYDVNLAPDIGFAELPATPEDHRLPGEHVSYFLEAGYGTRRLLGGHLITDLLTAAESAANFEMHQIAAASGSAFPTHVMPESQRFLHVLEGRLDITLDGAPHQLDAGGSAAVPAGIELSTLVSSSHARWLMVSTGDSASRYYKACAAETAYHTWAAGGGPEITSGSSTAQLRFL